MRWHKHGACCFLLAAAAGGGEGGVLAGTPIEGQLQKLLQQGRGKPSSWVGASARLRASLRPCFPSSTVAPPILHAGPAARSCTLRAPQFSVALSRGKRDGEKERENGWKKEMEKGAACGTAKKKKQKQKNTMQLRPRELTSPSRHHRSATPAHQQEGQARLAMPALPRHAQVAVGPHQVRLRREDAQVRAPEAGARRSQG